MSFQISISPHKRAAARLVGKVRRSLQKALAERPDVSRSEIARELDIHRSVITRQFGGTKDISLSRVAEIACVLGYEVEFDLVRHEQGVQDRENIAPNPVRSNFTTQVNGSNATTEVYNKDRLVLVR